MRLHGHNIILLRTDKGDRNSLPEQLLSNFITFQPRKELGNTAIELQCPRALITMIRRAPS